MRACIARPAEARGRLLLLKPSIVLLDLSSEEALRATPACQDLIDAAKNLPQPVPLLLLTDVDRFGLAEDLLRQGASDYLSKPFSADDLLRRIALALSLRPAAGAGRRPPGSAAVSSGEALGAAALDSELLAPRRGRKRR